jgi:monothiol glutaredoxin
VGNDGGARRPAVEPLKWSPEWWRRKEKAWISFIFTPRKEIAKSTSYASLVGTFDYLTMNKPKIIAYLKPHCGWSQGVRAIMRKYDLPFEDRDIINDPAQRQEMIEKSGQMLSPCVEVNGKMLPDISGEEVEAYLLANNLVQANNRQPDAPTNQPCAHEMPQSPISMQFRR